MLKARPLLFALSLPLPAMLINATETEEELPGWHALDRKSVV